jgi:hypothetical protein
MDHRFPNPNERTERDRETEANCLLARMAKAIESQQEQTFAERQKLLERLYAITTFGTASEEFVYQQTSFDKGPKSR